MSPLAAAHHWPHLQLAHLQPVLHFAFARLTCQTSTPLKLVKSKVSNALLKKTAGSRRVPDDTHAFRTATASPAGSKCPGCAGCTLHCVDARSGKWRAAPSSRSRGHAFIALENGCDSDNMYDVERAAYDRVDCASREARAMIAGHAFDNSADEGP